MRRMPRYEAYIHWQAGEASDTELQMLHLLLATCRLLPSQAHGKRVQEMPKKTTKRDSFIIQSCTVISRKSGGSWQWVKQGIPPDYLLFDVPLQCRDGPDFRS